MALQLAAAAGGDFLPDPEGPAGSVGVGGAGCLLWLHLLTLPAL